MSRKRAWWVIAAVVILVAPLVFLWWRSLSPASYSVMDMGRPDFGGGPIPRLHDSAHARTEPAQHAEARSVADLKDTSPTPAHIQITLTARQERVRLANGTELDGYTLNGQSPGPTINAVKGQVIEVTLVNDNVTEGTTLHWHGVDVPGAEDGVAGVTQDAVMPGQSYKYRFTPNQVGTFWYHSHQVSHQQVIGGLLGALVITPQSSMTPENDVPAVAHTYAGRRTINGAPGDTPLPAPKTATRVRMINTDNGPIQVRVAGGEYRVLAIDGTEVNRPGRISDRTVQVTAGARVDLEITGPARVDIGGAALVFGEPPAPGPNPTSSLDFLTYGEPASIDFDPERVNRRFDYRVGRFPGFVHGRPGMWWTINGRLYPDVPMFVVTRGDIVRMTISNTSGELHPMHLHGHHAVVLSRNGVRATGSPWWFDSLNVGNGETYEVAFIADNPGVWMDHCHQLQHAADGLVAHLMYEDVTTPFRLGSAHGNEPE